MMWMKQDHEGQPVFATDACLTELEDCPGNLNSFLCTNTTGTG